jgi:hypothetical protein
VLDSHHTPDADNQARETWLLNEIVPLFRRDAHARSISKPNGKGISYLRADGSITAEVVKRHVANGEQVGGYLFEPGSSDVRVGIIDIDDKKGEHPEAVRQLLRGVVALARERGLPAAPFRSGGGNGAHVWLTFDPAREAKDVRALLRWLCDRAGCTRRKEFELEFSGVTVEIFPKQDQVSSDGHGNLIGLPFSRHSRPLDDAGEPTRALPPLTPCDNGVLDVLLADIADTGFANDAPQAIDPRDLPQAPPWDRALVNDALRFWDADKRDDWVKAGFALRHAADDGHAPAEEARAVWLEWSKTSDKFDEAECTDKWERDFAKPRPGKRVGLGTIFYDAEKRGWKRPAAVPVAAEGDFRRNKKGVILEDDQHNIRLALAKLGARLSYDAFAGRLLIETSRGPGAQHLDDAALVSLYLQIDETFRFRPGWQFFTMVVMDAARRNAFHPVREYLASLKWDGQKRLDDWLVWYAGAADNELVRAVGAIIFIALVRRVRQPGVKFDEMPVLEGDQGKNKSTAMRIMAIKDDWYSDDLPLNADTQLVIERTRGIWVVEASELQGMRRGDVEHLKSFLSRTVDRARLAYGRTEAWVQRQFIVIGTTNSDDYLKDMTGNRRFWPVRIREFDIEALRRDIDQLYAEATEREAKGESIRLDPRLWEAAAKEQQARMVGDDWAVLVAEKLADPNKKEAEMLRGKIKTIDLWKIIGKPVGQITREDSVRLAGVMRTLGWENKPLTFGGYKHRAYVRGRGAEREQEIDVTRHPDTGVVTVRIVEQAKSHEQDELQLER